MKVMEVMSFTTVPVKPATLRRLRVYKTGGKSYDEVLNELMDEVTPERWIREHLRRLKEEESVPWQEVRRRLKR
jgi:hypothetical protein